MKRMIIGAVAVMAAFAATPAFAGSHISIGLFAPAPMVYEPAPVYYAPPVAYYPPVQQVYYAPARGPYYPARQWVREDRRFQVGYWDGRDNRRDGRWDRDDRRYR